MPLLTLAQNSDVVKNVLGPSIKGPEWNPTPGAQGLIDFSADISKRDAVVEAFKVLTSLSHSHPVL